MADDPLASFREAHGQTDEALIRISGLAHALYEIASGHPILGTSEPWAESIVSRIVVIEEKAELAGQLHQTEWDLIVKAEKQGT